MLFYLLWFIDLKISFAFLVHSKQSLLESMITIVIYKILVIYLENRKFQVYGMLLHIDRESKTTFTTVEKIRGAIDAVFTAINF